MNFYQLFDLAPTNHDAFAGQPLAYPWGGLYGGHIVGQALRAAAFSVDSGMLPHSLRAYFIRRGKNTMPVHYEVDRIRDGRSFCTRRVVARQDDGAILNLEASFQCGEQSADVTSIEHQQDISEPDEITETSWSELFQRRTVAPMALASFEREGSGRTAAWFKITDTLGDDELLNRCALAYLSDDLPNESVVAAIPEIELASSSGGTFHASLDHAVWFHRPVRADKWHLYEMSCHTYSGGRGLTHGFVFAHDGTHVATVAQETLVRIRP